ncbi:MAG: CapA family protein [Clostridiales bacterium]|nr:CapA family protein [Clostridiales bacterium]
MNKKRPGLSAGTILMLCLTVIVTAGCFLMFSRMRSGDVDVKLNARQMTDVLGHSASGNMQQHAPQATVRTVTVTVAPVRPTAPPAASEVPQLQAEASSTTVPASYSFSITVGGLLGFNSEVSDSVYDSAAKTFQYQPVLSFMGEELTADLNVAMLPHVINTADNKYADVLVPESILDAVRAAGVDDLLLNTEHILDQGIQGAKDTVSAILNRGFSCGGINLEGAGQSRIYQLNSARIALLSYTDAMTNKGKNALETVEGQGLMQLYQTQIAIRDIQAAKEAGANCVIVFLHWGKEDATAITKAQRQEAQALAEAGADIIIGYHPSRVLPAEIIETFDPNNGRMRKTLVAYSMGTLLTESRDGYDISGMLMHVDVTCDSAGNVKFNRIEYTPTYIWRQNVNGKMQYRVVASNAPAPEGMDNHQKEVMGRALERIKNTLKDSPAALRH